MWPCLHEEMWFHFQMFGLVGGSYSVKGFGIVGTTLDKGTSKKDVVIPPLFYSFNCSVPILCHLLPAEKQENALCFYSLLLISENWVLCF